MNHLDISITLILLTPSEAVWSEPACFVKSYLLEYIGWIFNTKAYSLSLSLFLWQLARAADVALTSLLFSDGRPSLNY